MRIHNNDVSTRIKFAPDYYTKKLQIIIGRSFHIVTPNIIKRSSEPKTIVNYFAVSAIPAEHACNKHHNNQLKGHMFPLRSSSLPVKDV